MRGVVGLGVSPSTTFSLPGPILLRRSSPLSAIWKVEIIEGVRDGVPAHEWVCKQGKDARCRCGMNG
jgi:hypothetical protein